MKRKPILGETLYELNIGNNARHSPQVLTEVQVVKVGRKYFTCQPPWARTGRGAIDYHIDSWDEKTEYCANHKLYGSREEWESEREANMLFKKLTGTFSYQIPESQRPPLVTLRKIIALIQEQSA